ncbi:MAG TPA: glycosyltransferase [Candidatus Kapabacteria bacterium]|nr:glycosyltransferase [Candidatus Kapabacteria bacterium]
MLLECEPDVQESVGLAVRPLHVLALTPFYPNDKNDVAGCFVAEPLRAMQAIGVRSTVEAVQPFYKMKVNANDEWPAAWDRYASLPGGVGLSSAGAFLFAKLVGKIRQLHAHDPIALIHAHAALPCGHAASLLSSQLGIPFVVTVHGLDAFYTNQVKGRAGEWCRRIAGHVYRSARNVICISEHVRGQVLNCTESSTSVVYNGVDHDFFAPANEPDNLKILSVGNLIPIKGHETLIRALAMLHAEIPDLSCEIIGDGPEREPLQKLAIKLNVENKIKFLGRQSREAVAKALRNSTLFVLPSTYEALGCVYLEAMSAAKPVIACRDQGIAEVIEHGKNGWLVGSDDANELAEGIRILIHDADLRNRMRLAARRTILKSLTLQHQAKRLGDIYRECVA